MWVRGSKANKTLEFQRPSDYIIYARHTLVFAVAWVLVGDLLCAAEVGHRNRSVGSGTMKLTKASHHTPWLGRDPGRGLPTANGPL